MNSPIQTCQVEVTKLDPVQAELEILITLGIPTPADLEIRGRFMGPRCLYRSTVQIAYPLKRLADPEDHVQRFRVIVPEPMLWDPQSPFWYEGRIETRQGGTVVENRVVPLGLRWLQTTATGLHINGRTLALNARRVKEVNPADLAGYRNSGINLLIVPVTTELEQICTLLDRMGIFLVGNLETEQEPPPWQSHPCLLGWRSPASLSSGVSLPVIFAESPNIVENVPILLNRTQSFLVLPPRQR